MEYPPTLYAVVGAGDGAIVVAVGTSTSWETAMRRNAAARRKERAKFMVLYVSSSDKILIGWAQRNYVVAANIC